MDLAQPPRLAADLVENKKQEIGADKTNEMNNLIATLDRVAEHDDVELLEQCLGERGRTRHRNNVVSWAL